MPKKPDHHPPALQYQKTFNELPCSPIGLGMAALGRPGYINLGHAADVNNSDYETMRQQAHRVLDEAHRLGIRYFDTAASYGAGEQFLGEWVFDRGHQVDGVTVASKWGYRYTAEWQANAEVHEVKDHSLENLKSSYVWSCLRLGKAMKIYQIHSATFESGVLDNHEVLDQLAWIKEQGRLIGLTVSGPRQSELIEKALDLNIEGERLFDVIQATWNPLEPSAAKSLSRAKSAGMAVIIKEAVANGRLTERNTESEFQPILEQLKSLSSQNNCSLDALVIAAAVNQPWVDVVLSGAVTLEQLKSNLSALEINWQNIDQSAFEGMAESKQQYWETRSQLVWN